MQKKQGKMSVVKQDEAGGSIQPDADSVIVPKSVTFSWPNSSAHD